MIDAAKTVRHSPAHDEPGDDGGTTASSRDDGHARTRSAAAALDHGGNGNRSRIGDILAWGLAVAACLWLALCTSIGPLYWNEQGLAQFSWLNAFYALVTFAVTLCCIIALVRVGRRQPVLPRSWHAARLRRRGRNRLVAAAKSRLLRVPLIRRVAGSTTRHGAHATRVMGEALVQGTNRFWKLALILFIGWLWIPVTLLSAFGADIRSQIREFSWAYNQLTGVRQPYIGFFSFVPMDIYPTAHYMWPTNPTYLTDQHNIVLTVFYGAVASISRYFTDSNDAGIVALSALQCLFAVFCCASCAHRFFNLPWRRSADHATPVEPGTAARTAPAGPMPRLLVLLFFLVCPLSIFSTISLTKSPVFAFAFLWWFGVGYELHMTRGASGSISRSTSSSTSRGAGRGGSPRAQTVTALVLSTCVMMISAKYAWYLLIIQVVLLVIADRRRWRTYAVALAVPVVLIHAGMALLFSTGVVISGDPIESRGIQLQQIARVAKLNPDGIPASARELLAPVFNLDQMADAYFQQDADPVKSSGIQAKKVSYRWRSVTKEDMRNFDKAWLQIVKANPRIAMDAFLAKCFGYFAVTDKPYVSMDYYLTNDYVTDWSTWIKSWQPRWRATVAKTAQRIGAIPVLGWLTHGNFYVVLTLLVGAAEVIERRWSTLVWHIPLLLLMGVMITSPANNFERHMLPVAFVFGFVALTFWRESQGQNHDQDGAVRESTGQ